MRLTKTFYNQLTHQIEVAGKTLDQFSFVKKKGWIIIYHDASKEYFSFIGKKSIEITTDNHQWEEKQIFKMKISDQQVINLDHWENVLSQFHTWVKHFDTAQ